MGLLINLKEDFMKKLMLAFVLLLGVVVSVKAQSIYGDKVKTDVKMNKIQYFYALFDYCTVVL